MEIFTDLPLKEAAGVARGGGTLPSAARVRLLPAAFHARVVPHAPRASAARPQIPAQAQGGCQARVQGVHRVRRPLLENIPCGPHAHPLWSQTLQLQHLLQGATPQHNYFHRSTTTFLKALFLKFCLMINNLEKHTFFARVQIYIN
jgi:hypothetical protein